MAVLTGSFCFHFRLLLFFSLVVVGLSEKNDYFSAGEEEKPLKLEGLAQPDDTSYVSPGLHPPAETRRYLEEYGVEKEAYANGGIVDKNSYIQTKTGIFKRIGNSVKCKSNKLMCALNKMIDAVRNKVRGMGDVLPLIFVSWLLLSAITYATNGSNLIRLCFANVKKIFLLIIEYIKSTDFRNIRDSAPRISTALVQTPILILFASIWAAAGTGIVTVPFIYLANKIQDAKWWKALRKRKNTAGNNKEGNSDTVDQFTSDSAASRKEELLKVAKKKYQ